MRRRIIRTSGRRSFKNRKLSMNDGFLMKKTDYAQPSNLSSGDDFSSKTKRGIFTYELVNNWIMNADAKVGVSCASLVAIYGIVLKLTEGSPWVISNNVNSWQGVVEAILSRLSFCFMILAVLFFLSSMYPMLQSCGEKRRKKKYPVYFRDIAECKKIDIYRNLMENGTEESFEEELVNEIYMNSKICYLKFRLYRCAVILSIFAIALNPCILILYHAIA